MSAARKPRAGMRPSQSGFTLVEILIGLALLALTVSLLPTALRLGLSAWTSRDDLDRVEGVRLMLRSLENQISQAMPIFERDKRGAVRIAFKGGDTSLAFIAPIETGPDGAGVFYVELAPRSPSAEGPDVDGLTMTLSRFDALPGVGQASAVSHDIAGRDVSVRFRYFGSQKSGEAGQWHSAWQRTDQFPMLVEISAVLRTAGGAHEHRQIIVPRINVRY